MSLVYPHAAVLLTPAIVGAVANPNLLPDYGEGSSLAEHDFSLTELVNDLFRCAGFLRHFLPPLFINQSNINVD